MITRTPISSIKSIQRGISASGSTTLDVAITSVNTSKSVISFLGVATNGTDPSYVPNINLASSTHLTITRQASVGTSANVSWEVIEYE